MTEDQYPRKFNKFDVNKIKLESQGRVSILPRVPINPPDSTANSQDIPDVKPPGVIDDGPSSDQESTSQSIATKSITRQNAIKIITSKLPGSEQYFYDSESFTFNPHDLRAINPLVNLEDMADVLSDIIDVNRPTNSLVAGIIGNAIIKRIRANQQVNPILSRYLKEVISKEYWMGINSEAEDVPPELVPVLNLGELVQKKLLSGGDILAIEAQSGLNGWNTDLLFMTLSGIHNRIVASCRNEGTEVEELSQFTQELTNHRRTVESLDPDSITLLQNIEYLFLGHK